MADFIFRDRQVRFPQEFLPGEEDFRFFARALIFEEIAHFYNRTTGRGRTPYGYWRGTLTAITPRMKHGTSPLVGYMSPKCGSDVASIGPSSRSAV